MAEAWYLLYGLRTFLSVFQRSLFYNTWYYKRVTVNPIQLKIMNFVCHWIFSIIFCIALIQKSTVITSIEPSAQPFFVFWPNSNEWGVQENIACVGEMTGAVFLLKHTPSYPKFAVSKCKSETWVSHTVRIQVLTLWSPRCLGEAVVTAG